MMREMIERIERSSIPEPNSGCMLWTDATAAHGYGQLVWQRKRYAAHRFAWIAKNGPIPDGAVVCHKCDVRSCVNPDHMFVGTQADNIHDMMVKGRKHPSPVYQGASHPNAKLTAQQVRDIRAETRPAKVAASEYGITAASFWRIRRGEAWRHV